MRAPRFRSRRSSCKVKSGPGASREPARHAPKLGRFDAVATAHILAPTGGVLGDRRRHPLHLQVVAGRCAKQLTLTDAGLTVQVTRPQLWLLDSIAAIRLSYRPASMQAWRFRADIATSSGQSIKVFSTTWHSISQMARQDDDYRAFIVELHRRLGKGQHRRQPHGWNQSGAVYDRTCRDGVDRPRHRRPVCPGAGPRPNSRARCFWWDLPRGSPGRSAASCAGTGRAATRSTRCQRMFCHRWVSSAGLHWPARPNLSRPMMGIISRRQPSLAKDGIARKA